jgi:uncharacterized repeat protein (TIGR04042 family)
VRVRWPDGRVEEHWSPSLVVHDHLSAGERYRVDDFVARCLAAMTEADRRVRARYGFACTGAAATVEAVGTSAERHRPDDVVEVLSVEPPLPPAEGAA